MKLITFTSLFLFLFTGMYAQSSNLIVYSESGEKFTLFLNGEQKNDKPLSNVKVEGINMEFAQLRVVFENSGVPELKQGISVEQGMEISALIKKNNKGNYVLRPAGSVPVSQSKPVTETVYVNPPPSTEAQPVTTTTVITTSNTTAVSPQGVVGVNVSDGVNSMNINMNVNTTGMNIPPQTAVTSTSVTTTSSYGETGNVPQQQQRTEVVPVEREGCSAAMFSDDFERAKKSIANKSFSEEKMTILKQILKANCVSVHQVVGFMGLFTYEADKVIVAKAAYPMTVDKENYFKVNDAFTYSGSVDELNKFLEAQ